MPHIIKAEGEEPLFKVGDDIRISKRFPIGHFRAPKDMIFDDIRQAQLRGDKEHVVTLLHVLHHFLKTHPEVRPSQHPWSKRF